MVSDEKHFGSPRISPTCGTNLESALSAFHSFTSPILSHILLYTNQRLRRKEIKEVSMDEFVGYIMFLMGVSAFSSDFEQGMKPKIYMAAWARTIRMETERKLKVAIKWPNRNRVQIIRNNLCMFDEESLGSGTDQMTSKIKDMIEIVNNISKDVVLVPGATEADLEIFLKYEFREGEVQDVLNNLCYGHVRYNPRISLSVMCTESERAMKKQTKGNGKPRTS